MTPKVKEEILDIFIASVKPSVAVSALSLQWAILTGKS